MKLVVLICAILFSVLAAEASAAQDRLAEKNITIIKAAGREIARVDHDTKSIVVTDPAAHLSSVKLKFIVVNGDDYITYIRSIRF